MNIIYSCFGGAHSSVVTASIHMGYLPIDRQPTKEEILSIPFYDKAQNEEIGKPLHMGVDKKSHRIYVMGMGHSRDYYTKMAYELYSQWMTTYKKDLVIINVTSLLNNATRLGGFLSRRLNVVGVGRPLTVYGIRKNYHYFTELVKNVQETIP
ncbi:DUF3189 family protein [Clostridium formicaceticum]|uniref:DUF3189 domain-containing protein n=1 Tax=Clostridium formicaceticum TaxID=1497 RepID=A0AAC9RLW3_9CLOT|nr:DUF3189 family protein [Clostridium formicaceticum]AOY77409.1 hypothetical protein BJL90_17065 [Clostridium formicaceticum]ARE87962.1 hypothetical protein CLFO_23630 [Clostridium formicaceticum]